MSRRVKVADHLGIDELEHRYRTAKEGIERSHFQIIWLLARHHTPAEVAEVTGYSRDWVYKLLRSYNLQGPSALGDKRHHNRGQPPLLDDLQLAYLWQALQTPPADGDLWDGPKVAQWMSALLERPVYPQRGWEYLKGLEMRLRRPRPHHQASDFAEQQQWKKNCLRL
jgi:transposase